MSRSASSRDRDPSAFRELNGEHLVPEAERGPGTPDLTRAIRPVGGFGEELGPRVCEKPGVSAVGAAEHGLKAFVDLAPVVTIGGELVGRCVDTRGE